MKYKKSLSLQELLNSSPSVDLGFEEHLIIVNAPEEDVPFDEIIAKAPKSEYSEWTLPAERPSVTHTKRSAH